MARLFPLGRARSRTPGRALGDPDACAAARGGDPTPDRGLRRKVSLLGCALSIALVTTMAPPVVADEDDRKEDLTERTKDIDKDLDRAHDDLHEVSTALVRATQELTRAQKRLEAAKGALATTRGELTAAQSIDDQMQDELEQAEAQLADAEAAAEKTSRRMSRLEDDMSDLLVSSYQYGSPGMASLDVILDGGDPNQLSENLSLADSVIGVQTLTLDQLTADQVLLQVELDRVEELRNEVAAKRETAAENLDLQVELTRQAQEQAAQVREIVATLAEAKQRAARAKQIELDRIAQLEASRARVEAMLRRLARKEKEAAAREERRLAREEEQVARQQGQPGPDFDAPSAGYLAWPIEGGYISSPYGMRFHPILHVLKLHDGTDFGVGCETPIYASASGSVVSAYYDAAYGNRVILANGIVGGDSLATSYNHLSADTVRVGEKVERGELIGFVGSTGYSTGCHLHFMVYLDGETTDPINWLS